MSHEPRIQQLADDLAAAGYRPFHAPCGIMLDESNPPFSTCIRSRRVERLPVPRAREVGRGGAGVRPALEHANVTLLTNAKVARLDTNDEGTAVAEVVVDLAGGEERFSADVVVVACGGGRHGQALLASANEEHPNGLANGSDQVGRNYMSTTRQRSSRFSREENQTAYQKTLGSTTSTSVRDDSEYPLGNVQVGKSTAPMSAASGLETRLAPSGHSIGMARHAIDFWLSTEDLHAPTTGSPSTVTGHHADLHGDDAEAKKRLYAKVKYVLGKLDMNPDHLIHRFAYMKNDIPIAGCAHQAWTCRFGTGLRVQCST